jgi:hypothetical protein
MGLMIFDLSSLSGRTILSAELDLYVTGNSYFDALAIPWDVYVLKDAWNPNTVDWNVVINLRYYTVLPAAALPGVGVLAFDVTNLVKNWVSGTYDNRGIVLAPDYYPSLPGFTTSDVFTVGGLYTTSQYQPKLIVHAQ